MSGGVDSSVTAALLKEQGHQVQGVFMAFGQPQLDAQIERVQRIAARLALSLTVVDLREAFEQRVLAYFCRAYCRGLTPNPCVVCNRTIKCGELLARLRARDSEISLATGHYARCVPDGAGPFELRRGRDAAKDQSYFLSQLGQEQLTHLLFPLGDYTKKEVQQLAAVYGLQDLHSPESQDICFLQESTVAAFLASHEPGLPGAGPIVSLAGRELGRHPGIHHFTVGQRRGLGLPDATPFYVVALESDGNRVVVGKRDDLLGRWLMVREPHWVAGLPPRLPQEFEVRIRHRHRAAPADVDWEQEGRLVITFREPQRAITPGQFAVLYHGDRVVGGGEIMPRPIRIRSDPA